MSLYVEKDGSIPVELEDYIPPVVKRLTLRIFQEQNKKIALFGFGDNMKWLYRVLRENGKNPILCDWREQYIGFDCGGAIVSDVCELKLIKETLLVCCAEEVSRLKDSMRFLIKSDLKHIPVLYDLSDTHDPYHTEEPFKSIVEKAKKRAVSMISDQQLFDLIQFVRNTADIPGDVVEYGSLHGGSGAIIVEAVNHFAAGNKKVWLFDTFSGIPESKYGLDYRWNGAFANNSYSEVSLAFSDCKNVKVICGNITETYDKFGKNKISFGYVASDTLETGELLLNYLWPKLSPGGIICVCDYGSYPNCVPLTVITDMFLEENQDAFVMHTTRVGIYIMKRL